MKGVLERAGWRVVFSWTVVALVGLAVLASVATFDVRDRQLAGDQASFVLQTLSLAYEGNLSYGQSDIELWRSLGWSNGADHPYGLHLQRNDHGWAFAKPYGHSLLASPVVRIVGPVPGFALVNAALLLALFVVTVLILQLRFSGAVVPLVAGAYVLGSHVRFWAYPVAPDLFLTVAVALVVLCSLRSLREHSWPWLVGATVLAVFVVSEKVTLALALAPLLALAAWRARSPRRGLLLAAIVLVSGLIFVFPYLHYSDWTSWTAYGGDRYVLTGPAPFEAGVPSNPRPSGTSEPFSIAFVLGEVVGVGTDSLHAGMTYVVGRHTGLLPFMPIALVALVLAIRHIRTSERSATNALLVGLLAYVALYLVVLTDNYFGGGQSIGNRYFLQVSPVVLGLLAVSRIPARELVVGAITSVAVSLLLIPHHHREPDRAFWRVGQVGAVQQLLPFESSQRNADFLRAGG